MQRAVLLTLLFCVSGLAAARPWNGIEPGVSKREDVTRKFGNPAKVVHLDGKDVLAYLGASAIHGTQQAQFRVDPANQVVERIDVFPGPVIDRDTVENTYGRACPNGQPAAGCYVKKVTPDLKTYFQYARLGLSVFFKDDGTTVQSFIFTSGKTAPRGS